jgi:hypothetical protein
VSDTHNFKAYKDAKQLLPHMEKILKIFDLSERSLSFYSVYVPAAKVLKIIKEQKSELQFHYDYYKKVKETKGKK